MSWQGLYGHDDVAQRFRVALAHGKLASTFLFVGPPGIGKRTFAQKLAAVLLCAETADEQMQACGACDNCVQLEAGTHPDLLQVSKAADRASIPLELLVGRDDKRMREGLCHDISLRPYMGRRRVALIDDADFLNAEGANALLKTLEEPPPRSVIILIGTSAEKQLPTIRSRSQIVRFRPLQDRVVAELLVAQKIVEDSDQAARVAAESAGSLARAIELADAESWQFRDRLLEQLAAPNIDAARLVEVVSTFVGESGTDAAAARGRARLALSFAIEHFRATLREQLAAHAGSDPPADAPPFSPEVDATLARIDRSLEAVVHVDRNANRNAYLAAWADETAGAVRRSTKVAG